MTTCYACQAPTNAYACERCTRPLHRALIQAAAIADELQTTITRQDRVVRQGGESLRDTKAMEPTTTVTGKPRQPNWLIEDRATLPAGALRPTGLPVQLDAADRTAAARNTITTWARTIIEERGLTVRPRAALVAGPQCVKPRCAHESCHRIAAMRAAVARYGDLDQLAHAALLIAQHLDWLRHRPQIEEALPELIDACRELERITDRPPDRQVVGACECRAVLYAVARQKVITCKDCGESWDVAATRETLLNYAQGYVFTAAEIAGLLAHLDPDGNRMRLRKRINAWASRGLIVSHGTRDGAPTFVLRDVLDRLTPRSLTATG